MSLSNIFFDDTKATFKDISCNTLNCENLNYPGKSPQIFNTTYTPVSNIAGAPTYDYSYFVKEGRKVSHYVGISGVNVVLPNTISEFKITLPENCYSSAEAEIKLIGACVAPEAFDLYMAATNSQAEPNQAVIKFTSSSVMTAFNISFKLHFEYVAE